MKIVVELQDGEKLETNSPEFAVADLGNGLVGVAGIVVNSILLRTIRVVDPSEG